MLRLAERFRRPDVDAFLASVGSRQITEWLVYYKIQADEDRRRRRRSELLGRLKNRGKRGRG